MRRDKKKKKDNKFGGQTRLSLFKKPDIRLKRSCPLSAKEAPKIDYKNFQAKVLKSSIFYMVVNIELPQQKNGC